MILPESTKEHSFVFSLGLNTQDFFFILTQRQYTARLLKPKFVFLLSNEHNKTVKILL